MQVTPASQVSRRRRGGPVRELLRSIDHHCLRRRLWLLSRAGFAGAGQVHRLSRRPVIIGGCGRSGTTLLRALLSCHPHVYAIPEETEALCPTAWPGPVVPGAEFLVPQLYRRLLAAEIPASCTRWCEKSPKNVLFIRRILCYFGRGARFIHLVRDGRDVITSRHPGNPSQFWVSPERWIQDVSAGARYDHHPQVLAVRYEDLVQEVRPTLRRICNFLQEPFDSAFLRYPTSARIPAWDGRPISPASIGRWRQPPFRERARALERSPRGRRLLEHYGYC